MRQHNMHKPAHAISLPHTRRFTTLLMLTATIGLAVSSCSSSAEPAALPEDSVAVDDQSIASSSNSDAADAESDGTEETGAEDTDEPDLAAVVIFDVLVTEPTVAGPHPELAWSAVDGAASYDLIVLDGAGDPYWAWSGEATSVYLGGVQNPDAVGAWVFEPLTWIVTARDSDGQPLAMSERAELLPG